MNKQQKKLVAAQLGGVFKVRLPDQYISRNELFNRGYDVSGMSDDKMRGLANYIAERLHKEIAPLIGESWVATVEYCAKGIPRRIDKNG
jgi:hypothetical protein